MTGVQAVAVRPLRLSQNWAIPPAPIEAKWKGNSIRSGTPEPQSPLTGLPSEAKSRSFESSGVGHPPSPCSLRTVALTNSARCNAGR